MQKSKGFTIIELLVVVAIIAVLTGIVLVNVTAYISRGRDAAARGNLASMLTNGAVFYDTNSNFTNFIGANATSGNYAAAAACTTGAATFTSPCSALTSTTAATGYTFTYACSTGAAAANCSSGAVQNWCGWITLKNGGNHFCVDSTGAKINNATVTCAAATGICS
jgi:prepilin-type N-terminal cleavage/methylation domain-containing protein